MGTVAILLTLLAAMTGLVAYSPTLYRWFCSATGYGGTVRRAVMPIDQAAAAPGPDAKKIVVIFDSNVAPGLPWDFKPEQRRIEVPFGKPTQVYYDAVNNSGETIVARAVYNITPDQVAPYFFKIQCFCFTNEKLKPGEHARMPLIFYIDKQATQDPDVQLVHEVTLSYTFYRQDDLTPEAVANTRDLGTGSAGEERQFKQSGTASFANDAKGSSR